MVKKKIMSVKRGLFLSFIGDTAIAGIVGAGGNIAASAIGAGFQAAQNRKDRQWQEHMQKAQWQAQEYFMGKQNEMNQENYLKYQSPAALRAQNESAGINSFAPDGSSIQPGSMAGVDQGSSGSVPGGSQPSPGAAIQPAFAQAANTILDAQFKQAQIDKANAEAERIRAETIAQNNQNSLFPLVQAGMENDNLSKKYQAALAEFNAANAQYRLELEAGKITAETKLALDRSKEALAKAAKTDSDRAWNDSINQSIVDLNKAKAGEAGANAGLAAAKTKTEDQFRDLRAEEIELGNLIAGVNYDQAEFDAAVKRAGLNDAKSTADALSRFFVNGGKLLNSDITEAKRNAALRAFERNMRAQGTPVRAWYEGQQVRFEYIDKK